MRRLKTIVGFVKQFKVGKRRNMGGYSLLFFFLLYLFICSFSFLSLKICYDANDRQFHPLPFLNSLVHASCFVFYLFRFTLGIVICKTSRLLPRQQLLYVRTCVALHIKLLHPLCSRQGSHHDPPPYPSPRTIAQFAFFLHLYS